MRSNQYLIVIYIYIGDKYLILSMMFKVRINAERKNGQYVGRIGEF